MIAVSAGTLGAVWRALHEPPWRNEAEVRRLTEVLLACGFAERVVIEDLLVAYDGRLHHLGDRLLDAIEDQFPKTRVATQPAIGADSASVVDAWTAADAAALCALIADIGFETDPQVLADWLLVEIVTRLVVTDSELQLLWFNRPKEPLWLIANGRLKGEGERVTPGLTTATGRHVSAWADGDITSIKIQRAGHG
jgi:hypothetical protein